MKPKLFVLSAVLTVSMVLSGCGASSDDKKDAAERNDTTTAVDVETIYKQNCISCHGTGMDKMADLTTVGSRLSKEEIANQIRKGGGGMIAFENRLKDSEINALADWLAAKK